MPLRDHFRPPVWQKASWEGLFGGWPVTIIQRLNVLLPGRFAAEPRVKLGPYRRIEEEYDLSQRVPAPVALGGRATGAAWGPLQPTFVAEFDPTEQYEYEVLIFDRECRRKLVAAVELVSPANKDRPHERRAFVANCAALLQRKVCVSIVDLVTIRKFNLYAEVLELFGHTDPALDESPPATYAVTCRSRRLADGSQFQTWAYPLVVGQLLPALPIWLTDDLAVSLDLESSYEDACRALRIS